MSAQALSSVSNFALGVVVVRSVSLADVGAFSIAYAMYLFVVGAFRAFGAKTFAVRYTNAAPADQRAGQRALTGLALVVGCAIGLAGVGASMLLTGTLRECVLVVSIFLPALLLQDTWRYSFVTVGRAPMAVGNDTVWITSMAIAIAFVLFGPGTPTASALLAAWAITGGVAGAIGIAQSRALPSPRAGLRFARTHGDMTWALVGEHVASQGANQAGLAILGGILPLSAIGALRAGQLMLSPLNVLQQASGLVGLPEASRASGRPHDLSAVVIRTGAALSVAACLVTVGLLVLPAAAGEWIFAGGWVAGQSLLVPLGVRNIAGGITIAGFLGLQALGHQRSTLRIGCVRGLASLTGAVAAGAILGLDAAVWAMAAADVLAAGLSLRTYRRTAEGRRLGDVPNRAHATPAAAVRSMGAEPQGMTS